MTEKKILLGLTTTPGSDWREKIREIDKFGIKEIALFPTFLKKEERQELYNLLERTGLKAIPHVHVRSEDMAPEEMDYLIGKYYSKVFNIHSPQAEYPVNYDYKRYEVYLENTHFVPTEDELKDYSGLCVDFSHWESCGKILKEKSYENFDSLVEKYPIGCCHISAVSKELGDYPEGKSYDCHWLNGFSELDYIKKYTQHLPNLISIELENSFEEQLKVKEYLEKIINGK